MFQIGDYVFKRNTGICYIEDVVHLDMRDIDRNQPYYLLIPISDDKTKIYIPTQKVSMTCRKILDEQEAWELIDQMPEIKIIKIRNERRREQEYKDALKSDDPKRWVSIVKTMYLRNKKRVAEGKKETMMDSRYFKMAENYLYSELAFAIGKKKNEMRRIIADTIKNQK